MIILKDTFNDRIISRHRKLETAVRARRKHANDLSRRSPGSYVWYGFHYENGELVDHEEIALLEYELINRKRS